MKFQKRVLAVALAAAMSVTVFGMTTFAVTVKIRHGSLSLYEGRDFDLSPYLELGYDQNDDGGLDASDVKWSSSSSRVADVGGNGTIHAKSGGTAIITASIPGEGSDEISVIVRDSGDDWEDWPSWTDRHRYYADYYDDRPIASGNTDRSLLTAIKFDRSPNLTKAADQAAVVNAASESPSARLDNYASVTVDALHAAANVSAGVINFDTRSGDNLVGRLQITPSKAASLESGTIQLGVHYMDSKTKTLTRRFNDTYASPVHVVLCEQDSFGMPVRLYVLLDADVDAEDLVFHTYNATTNAVSRLEVSDVAVDENGYVSFGTSSGGTILISDGALAAK